MNYLALSAALGILHVLASSAAASKERSLKWNLGARDETPPPPGKIAARLDRALKNFSETFPLFIAAVLGTFLLSKPLSEIETGMALYFWGRVAYLPIYALGIPVVRTLLWGVSMIGIGMIIWNGLT